MLKELPETLDEAYERILRDINKANWDHAHRLLQCLTVAVRPLRVAELAEVLAIDFGTTSRGETSKLNTDWRWEDQQEAVLSACSSLITIVDEKGSQIVQFSHFSVKEFLISSRITGSSADVSGFHILFEPAHTILANACIGVLLRLGEFVDEDNVRDKFPLALSTGSTMLNLRMSRPIYEKGWKISLTLINHISLLGCRSTTSTTGYFVVCLLIFMAVLLHEKFNVATPLYYAALCGFHDLTEQLIIKH